MRSGSTRPIRAPPALAKSRDEGEGHLTFADFRRTASQAFDAIPQRFREGIDALVTEREAIPHPTLPDIFTLGYCDTEVYPSEWAGPDTVRSVVTLNYGSFRQLARLNADFDWTAEIYETVEHEVRHHLESLAGEDTLAGVDYGLDQSFNRAEGREWDPWYFQGGDTIGRATYAIEDQVYIEQEWSSQEFEQTSEIEFVWRGTTYRFPRPQELGDIHFVWMESGISLAPPRLEVVLVRRRRWRDDARRLVSSARTRVIESQAVAKRSPDE